MTEIKLPPLPEGWETELLDWVSACQSAYHIDNTPSHRFGGLGSNLEENRSEIVCFVRGLIESHAAALQSQDQEDSERLEFITGEDSKWSVMRQKVGDKPTRYKMRYDGELVGPWFNTAREAIDHARRIEGDSNDT